MNTTNDRIHAVLKDHPKLDSAEEIQEECAKRGVTVGLLTVYYVGKFVGRELKRRPVLSDPQEVIHEVASALRGQHESPDAAVATLQEVGKRNKGGDRIPWEREMTSVADTWELSVGQELIDLCDGSVDKAIKAVTPC